MGRSKLKCHPRPGDQILVMSNGGFGGIHQRILDALQGQPAN